MYYFLAFASGITVIVSMIINSHLAERTGVFKSCRVNFLVGLISISLILFFNKGFSKDIFSNLTSYPFWVYLGGLIGVIIVVISNIIVLKIPTIYFTLILFVGQLSMSIVIDYFVQNNFSLGKLIGGVLILLGLLYNFRVDKMKAKVNCETVQS